MGNGNRNDDMADKTPPIKVGPLNPLDDIMAAVMQTSARKGRGFVLDLINGDKPTIEVKESLPPHDEYEPPAAYRDHTIRDTESFVDYAKRYGTQKESIVLYNTQKATLVINEFILKGQRETVELPFLTSPDWQAWSGMLNKQVSHRELMNFLMRQEHNLAGGEVLASMQSLKINSVINHESDIRDDGQTVGIMVKTSAGDELKKFPKSFDLIIPILEQDVDASRWANVEVRMNIMLPTEAKQGAMFTLICSTWPQDLILRIKKEGDAIRAGLPEWTVVHGVYEVKARELPQAD